MNDYSEETGFGSGIGCYSIRRLFLCIAFAQWSESVLEGSRQSDLVIM